MQNSFSVLMSVYHKESAINLEQCLESLVLQTFPASEIIIVKDGKQTDNLEKILLEWKEKLPIKIVGYEENKGLAYALNYGLQFCSCDLIARMDSDDICTNNRFEKQIRFFEKNKNISLLSGYISEFDKRPTDITSIRYVPLGNKNILKYLKRRNAFNHMAVMFKKTTVFDVGCYQGIDGFEDYDLWIRIVQAGYEVDNLPEILVYARVGNNMIGRRRGITYAKKEIDFWYAQRQKKFISYFEYIVLLLFRIPFRLIPQDLLSFIYINFLR